MNTEDKLKSRKLLLWILIPAALAAAGLLLILQLCSGHASKPASVTTRTSPQKLDLQIQSISGRVEVERAGLSGRFRLGALSPLLAGDQIFVPTQARLVLSAKGLRLLLGPDSHLALRSDSELLLNAGVLAGDCAGHPLELKTAEGLVRLRKGRFVLQRQGGQAWSLLLAEGKAEIRPDEDKKFVTVHGGQTARAERRQGVWFLRQESAAGPEHPLLKRMDPRSLLPKKKP